MSALYHSRDLIAAASGLNGFGLVAGEPTRPTNRSLTGAPGRPSCEGREEGEELHFPNVFPRRGRVARRGILLAFLEGLGMEVAALVVSIAAVLFAGVAAAAAAVRSASAAKTSAETASTMLDREKVQAAIEEGLQLLNDALQTFARRDALRRDDKVSTGWTANETNRAKRGPEIDGFNKELVDVRTRYNTGALNHAEALSAAKATVEKIVQWQKLHFG